MDSIDYTTSLLQRVKDGTLSVDKAALELSRSTAHPTPSALSSFANIDHDRYTRTNFPEVIFAQSKTSHQVATILDEMAERQIMKQHQAAAVVPKQQQQYDTPPILATRYVTNLLYALSFTFSTYIFDLTK